MAIITKIEAQKKNTDRVNIYINDEFFMSVFTELVYTFNLKKGMEINKENLKTLLDDDMYIKAKNKALNILSLPLELFPIKNAISGITKLLLLHLQPPDLPHRPPEVLQ